MLNTEHVRRTHCSPIRCGSVVAVAIMFAMTIMSTPIWAADVAAKPTPATLAQLWREVGSNDFGVAYGAAEGLAGRGDEAVTFVAEKLKGAAAEVAAKRIEGLIARLDAPKFADREAVQKSLARLAARIEPLLRNVLGRGPYRRGAESPPGGSGDRLRADR